MKKVLSVLVTMFMLGVLGCGKKSKNSDAWSGADSGTEASEQGGCIGGDEGYDALFDDGLVDPIELVSDLDSGGEIPQAEAKDDFTFEVSDSKDIFEVIETIEVQDEDVKTADEGVVPQCPDDMVLVQLPDGRRFCIDRFEASHSDATETYKGSSPIPASRQGVLPWFPVDFETAKTACESVSKRLCRPEEWFEACSGPDHTVYSYGNNYSATICNGIDAFCHCDPYPHCYPVCGAYFHVVPTGAFPDCTNEWGVYDINGNVWEIVDYGDGLEHFRGGAYNCGDSEALHRCDYDATWNPSAKGFRCCKDVN